MGVKQTVELECDHCNQSVAPTDEVLQAIGLSGKVVHWTTCVEQMSADELIETLQLRVFKTTGADLVASAGRADTGTPLWTAEEVVLPEPEAPSEA